MDVFMIGNGFDLHYCLPTTYTCFLRTVENICKRLAAGEQLTSVAQIFSDPELHNSDSAIKRCYDTYGKKYNTELNQNYLREVFAHAKENVWFSYMLRSFDIGKGWVDFEREIAIVTQVLTVLFDTKLIDGDSVYLWAAEEDRLKNFICLQFSFMFSETRSEGVDDDGKPAYFYPIKQEYLQEEPCGSGALQINERKIASDLFAALRELADMLAAYLLLFVDVPVRELIQNQCIKLEGGLKNQKWAETAVISFNYTHTLANLYCPEKNIRHVHGELSAFPESTIVLGVDADRLDETGKNVTFIQFKKYYQRAFYQTDSSYISFIEALAQSPATRHDLRLFVLGHSLDKTDQEIIRELFTRAKNITIFFHDDSAVTDYIRNLVSIFGKKKFDLLREKKQMAFRPLELLNFDNFAFNID